MSERTDTERLDWLEKQSTGYGRGWAARMSFTGRGFRLHETSLPIARPTVREAIDTAMDEEEIVTGDRNQLVRKYLREL